MKFTYNILTSFLCIWMSYVSAIKITTEIENNSHVDLHFALGTHAITIDVKAKEYIQEKVFDTDGDNFSHWSNSSASSWPCTISYRTNDNYRTNVSGKIISNSFLLDAYADKIGKKWIDGGSKNSELEVDLYFGINEDGTFQIINHTISTIFEGKLDLPPISLSKNQERVYIENMHNELLENNKIYYPIPKQALHIIRKITEAISKPTIKYQSTGEVSFKIRKDVPLIVEGHFEVQKYDSIKEGYDVESKNIQNFRISVNKDIGGDAKIFYEIDKSNLRNQHKIVIDAVHFTKKDGFNVQHNLIGEKAVLDEDFTDHTFQIDTKTNKATLKISFPNLKIIVDNSLTEEDIIFYHDSDSDEYTSIEPKAPEFEYDGNELYHVFIEQIR